jgi:hypothetical protein
VNQDSFHLLQRPYSEIVDDLLTSLVGGVVNEPVEFDVKSDAYSLAEPARGVRGVTGTRARERHAFVPEVDFRFAEEDNALVWREDGDRPDDETIFFVDYFRRESRSPLTDLNVGSVVRTLAEAVGREIATVYQQIHRAYLSAFLDTAEGRSLELVVAILGITRKTGEFASGLATFFRDPAVEGNITIPQGLGLTTETGDAVFETTEPRTLQRGQGRIDVPIRAAEGFAGEAGLVAAGAIARVTRPVAGIARVTNFDATALAAGDETDEELRLRARAALRSLGKATLAALDRVIREGRGEPLEIWDPNSPPERRSAPGTVTVLLEAEAERFPSLEAAVHVTRAAGVLVTLLARHVFFTPRLAARVPADLSGPGRAKVQEEVIAAGQAYVHKLKSGEPAVGKDLIAAVRKGAPAAAEPVVRDVFVTRTSVQGPGPSGEPAGRRIPDRSLLQSTAEGREGEPATDEEIEAGTFRVSADVDGETWWVALEMARADVLLETEGEGS